MKIYPAGIETNNNPKLLPILNRTLLSFYDLHTVKKRIHTFEYIKNENLLSRNSSR